VDYSAEQSARCRHLSGKIAEARNLLKYGNSVGPTYEALLETYETDEAVRQAAGRTSPLLEQLLRSMSRKA
jgi:hypothetical protein